LEKNNSGPAPKSERPVFQPWVVGNQALPCHWVFRITEKRPQAILFSGHLHLVRGPLRATNQISAALAATSTAQSISKPRAFQDRGECSLPWTRRRRPPGPGVLGFPYWGNMSCASPPQRWRNLSAKHSGRTVSTTTRYDGAWWGGSVYKSGVHATDSRVVLSCEQR